MGVLDIINTNMVLHVRLVLYGALIFFSFFIFVGVAVMKDSAVGCPLYCTQLLPNYYFVSCGSASNCNYPMAVAIMFQLLYLGFRVASLLLLLIQKLTNEMFLFSDILELVYTVADLAIFFLTFIGACILSAGINSTCSGFRVCDSLGIKEKMSASQAAQAGAWISTFIWLFVGVLGFIHLLRSGKIPFLGGSAAANSGGGPSDGAASPNQDFPPGSIYDPPRY